MISMNPEPAALAAAPARPEDPARGWPARMDQKTVRLFLSVLIRGAAGAALPRPYTAKRIQDFQNEHGLPRLRFGTRRGRVEYERDLVHRWATDHCRKGRYASEPTLITIAHPYPGPQA